MSIPKNERDVLAFALRYALPRRTGVARTVCEYIAQQIPRMDDIDKQDMIEEVHGLFKSCADDYARTYATNLLRDLEKSQTKER